MEGIEPLLYINRKHRYGYKKVTLPNVLIEGLIFKKISDDFAVEIGSGFKFLIADSNKINIGSGLTNEEFSTLHKEIEACPLLIDLDSYNPEKINNDNDKLDYIKNFARNMQALKEGRRAIKDTYNEEWECILNKISLIDAFDDIIYSYDKTYALKNDE